MKRILLLIWVCLTASFCRAQMMVVKSDTIGPAATRLSQWYDVLMKNKLSTYSQLQFLKQFPDTKDKFMAIFDPDDHKELHKVSHQYMEAFKYVGIAFPDSVLRVGLAIGKQMEWSSGPSEELQHTLLEIASTHTESFANEIYRLRKKEIDGVVKYLADVEQEPLCSLYKDLVKNLQDLEYYDLSGRLVRAKGTSH